MPDAEPEPLPGGSSADGEEAAVNDFLAMFLRDRAAGESRAVRCYQELFPRHAARIAREHAALTAVEPQQEPEPLPTIPQVRLECEIGRGGQGVVYRGRQEFLDRTVAVKVLWTSAADAPFTRRFRREAKTLAGLQHPNIVACHQAGVGDDGVCYIVMELVEGPSLRDWLRTHPPLSPRAAVALARDLAGALAHAQSAGIVHRDVKAENVLLQQQAGDDEFPFRAKLVDLGLARPLAFDAQLSGATPFGVVLGTPVTMAPEQFDAPHSVDHRADIYGLGCVLYLALTGVQPFAGAGMRALMQQKEQPLGPDPRRAAANVPAELAELVQRMMARDAGARPQSYAELAAGLTAALATPAPAAATRPTTRGPLRRALYYAGGALALLAGILVLAWPTAQQAAGAGDDRPAPMPATPAPWRVEELFAAGDDPFVDWEGEGAGGIDDDSKAPTLSHGRGPASARRRWQGTEFVLQGQLCPCLQNDGRPIAATGVSCELGDLAVVAVDLRLDGETYLASVQRRERATVDEPWRSVGDPRPVPGRWSKMLPLSFSLRREGAAVAWQAGAVAGPPQAAGTFDGIAAGATATTVTLSVDGGLAIFPGFQLQVRP